MCEIMEELKRNSIRESQIAIAQNMLADGSLTLDFIAKITELTLEEVQALAEGKQI